MNLIKINPEHYVIVDDSEIKAGDVVAEKLITGEYELFEIHNTYDIDSSSQKVITHSTQPFNCNCSNKGYRLDTNCAERNHCLDKIQYLSLQEVKELIGEVDVEKKAEKFIGCEYADIEDNIDQVGYDSFIRGYTQCLEDNKDRKYTRDEVHGLMCKAFIQGWKKADVVDAGLEGLETDVECAWILMRYDTTPLKTQWIVDFVDGKLKLKQ